MTKRKPPPAPLKRHPCVWGMSYLVKLSNQKQVDQKMGNAFLQARKQTAPIHSHTLCPEIPKLLAFFWLGSVPIGVRCVRQRSLVKQFHAICIELGLIWNDENTTPVSAHKDQHVHPMQPLCHVIPSQLRPHPLKQYRAT